VIIIEPVTPLNAFIFKAVRLRALQDAPHAFGSTYAKESQFADSEWLARVQRMNGESGAGFLAIDGELSLLGHFWTKTIQREHTLSRCGRPLRTVSKA